MKVSGIVLLVLGLITAAIALRLPVTASTEVPSELGYGLTRTVSGVYNLGLLQRQVLTFIGGCAAAIAGSVFCAAGVLQEMLATPAKAERTAAAPIAIRHPPRTAEPRELESERQQDRFVFYIVGGVLLVVMVVVLLDQLTRATP